MASVTPVSVEKTNLAYPAFRRSKPASRCSFSDQKTIHRALEIASAPERAILPRNTREHNKNRLSMLADLTTKHTKQTKKVKFKEHFNFCCRAEETLLI